MGEGQHELYHHVQEGRGRGWWREEGQYRIRHQTQNLCLPPGCNDISRSSRFVVVDHDLRDVSVEAVSCLGEFTESLQISDLFSHRVMGSSALPSHCLALSNRPTNKLIC